MSEEKESKTDVCPECSVRDEDSSEKELHQCSYCGRWFCKKHLPPRLSFFPDLKHLRKDDKLQAIYERERKREDGHPDFAYAVEWHRKYEKETAEERERYLDAFEALINQRGNLYDKRASNTFKTKLLSSTPDRPQTSESSGKTLDGTSSNAEEYHFDKRDARREDEGYGRKTETKANMHYVRNAVAVLAIITILGVVIWNAPIISQILQKTTSTTLPQAHTHGELVDHALSLINLDRQSGNLSNVSLSLVDSGQRHADDMLLNNYLSHWDTQGYKPYMRYTLTGGRGSVAENIAWYYSSASFDLGEAIRDLEWQMVHNDSSSGWGHKKNILNAFHNKVSIGIASDRNNLYLVQDFENDYIEWSKMNVSRSDQTTIIGAFKHRQPTVQSVNIFYDNLPTNLTSAQLRLPIYSGSYGMGDFVGMALPAGYESTEGITIAAQTWLQTEQAFQALFDLSPAFATHGRGVYTLYVQPSQDSEESFTSYSIWYYG